MAAPFGAVAPGTDLGDRARELRRVHEAVLTGVRPPAHPRPVVARSWRRVLGMGLAPERAGGPGDPDRALLDARRAASPLRHVIEELRACLMLAADAAQHLMVVTDAEGVILWREGASPVRRTADRLGFAEGARWTEQQVGTNAIGTALAEEAPVELFGAEHFERQQHGWYCSAVPMHDPRTGALMGVLDVSGPAMALHPLVPALVASSARLAESSLWQWHRARLERLRRSSEHLAAAGPALVVDDDGWVAHHVGTSVRDRIAAPAHGRPIAVPGMGLCLPERVPGGWLVRPAGRRVRIRATLHGTSLEVQAGDERWQLLLTPRHAQVLGLLADAGREGLGSGALSSALYGDVAHAVSVRAEVSRLRRVVGGLVETSPYRLAEGFELRVTQAGDGA